MTSSSSPFTPSPRLIAWARQAGYEFDAHGPGGSSAFHNAGWETAFYVRAAAGPFLRISSSTRNHDEDYLADVSTAAVAEDFFLIEFGSSVRSALRLPRIRLPLSRDDAYPGFRVDDARADRLVLLDGTGEPVVVMDRPWDPFSDVATLVKLSWGIGAPSDSVAESFISPTGQPLFELK